MDRPLRRNLVALRAGEVIPFEGMSLRMIAGKENGRLLSAGDTYYAARNTEQLFTVKNVNLNEGWVVPVEVGYPFDLGECVGVEIILD